MMLVSKFVAFGLLLRVGKCSWPIDFKKTSSTVPSLEVRLVPSGDPLPQVSALLQLLERKRMRIQEALMAKLEDLFNKQLDDAQALIQESVTRAMKVFEDKAFLERVVKGSLQALHSPSSQAAQLKSEFPTFRQLIGNTTTPSSSTVNDRESPPSEPNENLTQLEGPLSDFLQRDVMQPVSRHPLYLEGINPVSFIQVGAKSKGAGDVVNNVMKRLGNSMAPMLNVEVVDIAAPDESISDKIEQMEQLNNDEEGRRFDQEAEELEQITKITIQELDKNIQIQMNSFLVDLDSVSSILKSSLKKYPLPGRQLSAPVAKKSGLFSFRAKHRKARKSNTSAVLQRDAFISFLQVKEVLNPEQLNVKVVASEYPTIADFVDDSEKKREATERLQRAKALELQLRLMKAQQEMIKDTLHSAITRVIALAGQTVDDEASIELIHFRRSR